MYIRSGTSILNRKVENQSNRYNVGIIQKNRNHVSFGKTDEKKGL